MPLKVEEKNKQNSGQKLREWNLKQKETKRGGVKVTNYPGFRGL
jgi:hypothetical protein